MITKDEVERFEYSTTVKTCAGCNNKCLLTINTFKNGSFVTGNRCERGVLLNTTDKARAGLAGAAIASQKGVSEARGRSGGDSKSGNDINLYKYKFDRIFGNAVTKRSGETQQQNTKNKRGTVGMARVLNMYENYPLWYTIFSELGFCVKLSSVSNKNTYKSGIDTIPSESVCFPAKLAHGHVINLLKSLRQQGSVSHTKAGDKYFVFLPCVPYEVMEDKSAGNHYNCPVVTSYPEVLRNNIDALNAPDVLYIDSFLPIYDKKRLAARLIEELSPLFDICDKEVIEAVDKGWAAQERAKRDIADEGERAVESLIRSGESGIVLCGRPYHTDPQVNHGIPELIASLGLAVLTEDSVAQFGQVERPLTVVDQWVYHNRLYRAADFVAGMPNLELVQLTSFGCGLDAVTSDEVSDIMKARGRFYTLIKIDEGENLGAVKIRIRSLIEAMKARKKRSATQKLIGGAVDYGGETAAKPTLYPFKKVEFTKEMRATYTILGPQMAPLHFELLQEAMRASGYNFEVLGAVDPNAVEAGLKYVNNDACYPSILVAGQLIAALQSGRYDVNRTALIITQTGGGCRATNYIGFIRRALADAGLSQVPVISLSASALEKNSGFKMTPVLLHRMVTAIVIGDVLMKVTLRTRPYEKEAGSVNALQRKWVAEAKKQIHTSSITGFNRVIKGIIKDFDEVPLRAVKKARVGVVGEILVKFHPTANNKIVEEIEGEGAEAVVPDLLDFFLYTFSTGIFRHDKLAFPKSVKTTAELLVWFMELYRAKERKYLRASKRFEPPQRIYDLMDKAKGVVQLGNITGEGWLLTAEMVELVTSGVPSVACIQPFACLPNHITGKGVIKTLRTMYPKSNIAAIDYDPGASQVNQVNRLKLLLATSPVGKHPDEREDGLIDTAEGAVTPTVEMPRGSLLALFGGDERTEPGVVATSQL